MLRMLSTFTWYANYHFPVNNDGGISKNEIFQQFGQTISKNYLFYEMEIF